MQALAQGLRETEREREREERQAQNESKEEPAKNQASLFLVATRQRPDKRQQRRNDDDDVNVGETTIENGALVLLGPILIKARGRSTVHLCLSLALSICLLTDCLSVWPPQPQEKKSNKYGGAPARIVAMLRRKQNYVRLFSALQSVYINTRCGSSALRRVNKDTLPAFWMSDAAQLTD